MMVIITWAHYQSAQHCRIWQVLSDSLTTFLTHSFCFCAYSLTPFLTHSFYFCAYSLTPLFAHSFYFCAYSLTPLFARSLLWSLTHSLTLGLYWKKRWVLLRYWNWPWGSDKIGMRWYEKGWECMSRDEWG